MRIKILILIPAILIVTGIVFFFAVQSKAGTEIFPERAGTAERASEEAAAEETETESAEAANGKTRSTAEGSEAEDPDEKTIYLTFDDGPSEMTPLILDILEDYQVKATFFVTGINPDCAEYIREAYEAGHTIGMHTYSHDYEKIYSSVGAYYEDLDKIAEVCGEQIGYVPKYIRFPGGSSNTVSAKYSPGIMTYLTKDVTRRGYVYCDWNCANGDGEGDLTAEELAENAAGGTQYRQAVMLCHDGNGKRSTVDALPRIIDYYLSEGYVFRPIGESAQIPHHAVKN